jgi:hypothetical protein
MTARFLSTVDCYTSSVENLLHYPMKYCFYPERTRMPHEPELDVPLTEVPPSRHDPYMVRRQAIRSD